MGHDDRLRLRDAFSRGRPAVPSMKSLDHAEHDGADEGHGEIRGDYAQSPGEGHEVVPSMRAAPRAWLMVNRKSLLEKVSLAVARVCEPGAAAPGMVKEH